jgi:LDH2 family malate/lactate/ureidoglycolate dehydrogenase
MPSKGGDIRPPWSSRPVEGQPAPATLEEKLLTDWATSALRAAGLSPADAVTVVNSLLFAQRRGVATHGLARMPSYTKRIIAGGIRAHARPEIVRDVGGVRVVDGRGAAGAVTAMYAARAAAAKTRIHGIGVSLVRGVNDVGALGYYASQLAADGYIGVVACNTDPVMSAPNVGKPVLGTNPLAVAVPNTDLLLDMATSAAAWGKIAEADANGHSIPLHWAVDRHGRPTTDPAAALCGALLPVGGYKGFGLALIIDVLAAVAGADTSPFIAPVDQPLSQPQNLGMTILALDPAVVGDPTAFAAKVQRLIDAVHESSDGATSAALVPGEPEAAYSRKMGTRIAVDRRLLTELRELGSELNVPFPE